ncbi:mannitol dehydrogenase family protein [Jhaorihella thermophila]|uniref:Mannitol 2-dehydrogenase n=1 Tax=Jhaorihella thermophila TaxID=488547 RepID=A0A1H5US51_9RHOB|nr:mannitol dehydrogenase family protein [Jhaorihella thermophila]SEF77261.1 mannitol 2-dehydrogenase [Jhaorihella thermophila]
MTPAPHITPSPLSAATLDRLPSATQRPAYDRARLRPGILHVGVGNFHRAHQAVYLDDLFGLGRDHDWAIGGAGLMPGDARQRDLLAPQDWLYSVTELAPDRTEARVIGAMVDFLPADPQALAARIADPSVRIVSLTITEGGYFIDAATGEFDANHPAIRADAENPDAPRTVFGALFKGLRLRRDRGLAPPAVLSCDNVQGNGKVTRAAVEGLAAMISDGLRDWVAGNVAFPNGMVDRITPATTDAERALIAREFGLADASPVVCEPFRRWVLEDDFPLGRPALEEVGVQFVADVAPYETMKLRILNAGHAAIAYPAALLGHVHVHEAMADPDIAAWLHALMTREVIPVLPPIAGEDYHAYLATCADRFANPRVRDTVARLAQDGSNRLPKFILPTVSEALQAGGEIDGLALEVAFWCRHCAAGGRPDDPRGDRLRAAAEATRTNPAAFLALADVFGPLGGEARFAQAFGRWIDRLWREPARAVLRDYLNGRAG